MSLPNSCNSADTSFSKPLCAQILDSIPLHVAVLDAAGNIVAVNRAWSTFAEQNDAGDAPDVFGTGANYFETCRRATCECRAEAQKVIAGVQAVIDGRVRSFHQEYACHSPSQERWFTLSAFAMDGDGGRVVMLHEDTTHKHKTNERLEVFSLVLQRTDNAVIITNSEGMIEWVNEGFTRITEYSLEEVLGKKPGLILQGPDTDPSVVRTIASALREGNGVKAELVNYSKSGRRYWIEIEIQALRGNDGRIEHFMSIEADITARKDAEAMLRLERDHSRRLIQESPELVIGVKPTGEILYLNPSARKMLGCNDDVIGAHWQRVMAARGSTLRTEDENVLPLVAHERIETTFNAPGGGEVTVSWRLIPREDAWGAVEEVVFFGHNVTEHKQREEQLRAWAEIEQIENSVRGLMLEHHGDNAFIAVHRRVIEHFSGVAGFFGYIRESDGALVCPSMIGDMFPNRRLGPGEAILPVSNWGGLWGEVLRTRKPKRNTVGHRGPVGHMPIYRSMAAPLLLSDELLGIILVANLERDYTSADLAILERIANVVAPVLKLRMEQWQAEADRKKHEEQLIEHARELDEARRRLEQQTEALGLQSEELIVAERRAQLASEAKSEFLATVSHEIRTPLTAILGFSDLLLADTESLETDRVEALETIRRNGEHLLEVINDILDISKIEAGKFAIEKVSCSPHRIIAEVLQLLGNRARGKGIRLFVRGHTLVPDQVVTDPTRLRQILINLVGNAIKFTEVGQVTLDVGINGNSENAKLEILVQDTGIGIAPDRADRLFKPFGQVDSSMTRRFGGTGLGLSIARRLAESLDGGVDLVWTEPGKGSQFRATIGIGSVNGVPLRPVDELSASEVLAEQSPRVAPAILSTCLAGRRVLLAEDGPDNQRLISHLLRKAGACVTVVDNGQQAVEEVLNAERLEHYDIVLMDMQMPVKDGYQATKDLRDMGFDRPVIALTAHAMAGDREKCLRAGCSEYIGKPIDRTKLIAALVQHLEADVPSVAAHDG